MNEDKLHPLLIMFVDLEKFSYLFRNNIQNVIPNYDQINIEKVICFVNNTVKVIDIAAGCEFNNALCIILSDNIKNFSFDPVADYKILYHTGTNEDKLTPLRQNSFYKGELKSMEEADQIYGAIAKAIEDGNFFDKFQSFYDQIPNFNYLLEAKLNLLHQCLTPQGTKEANPDWLQGDAQTKFDNLKNTDIEDPFNPDYMKALADLRDELLKEY